MLLIRDADVYAPDARGRQDILVAGGRIEAMAEQIDPKRLPADCLIIEAGGRRLIPGLVDGHVHVTGGGGEGGFQTRTPELTLSGAIRHGVTSVVGVLGTDGVSRSVEALVAKTYALRAEGLSAWCLTGAYRVPLPTLTGDVMRDIMFIEPVLGVGEVAVSDHRSSQPSQAELARLAADARVAGLLAGKAGLVNVHLGDAPAGLNPLIALCASGELPREQFLPTHCNRNPRLLEQALAWLQAGGAVDFTASADDTVLGDGETSAAAALARCRDAGLALTRVTVSSDGQGSLPRFDAAGRLCGLGVGDCGSLLLALRQAVADHGLDLAEALPAFTANPARLYGLAGKGRVQPGAAADLVLLDDAWQPHTVVAGGRIMVQAGQLLARGTFE